MLKLINNLVVKPRDFDSVVTTGDVYLNREASSTPQFLYHLMSNCPPLALGLPIGKGLTNFLGAWYDSQSPADDLAVRRTSKNR